MSTYTDLHVRRKENLTILRMPGDPNDGITPQRVILANPENIYDGTFRGKVETSAADFNNVTLNDSTINGGVISNAVIYSGGEQIALTDLTAGTSEITGNIAVLQQQMASVKLSCDELNSKIDGVSDAIDKEIENIITGDAGFSKIIGSVSTEISGTVDNRLEKLCTDISSSVDSQLKDLELSTKNLELSALNINSKAHDLSNSISSEIKDRIAADDALLNIISENSSKVNDFISNDFTAHVNDNAKSFAELSNQLLSAIERDKHYKIIDSGFDAIPYKVKDYSVNVIEAGATDVKITYNDKTIGYGTYVDPEHTKLKVAITTDNKIPELVSAIPGNYVTELQPGFDASQHIKGAYFYNITWLSTDQKIRLDKVDQSFYSVIEPTYNALVGTVVDAEVDENGKFLSGRMLFEADGSFNSFYESFKNGWTFDNAALSAALTPDGRHRAQLNSDGKTFSFGFGIQTAQINEIKDNVDNAVFGAVITDSTKTDGDSSISAISINQVNLAKYGVAVLRDTAATLTKDNGFTARLDTDIVLSAKIAEDNQHAVFSVIKTKEKFAYPFYSPIVVGEQPQLSAAQGCIIPDIENHKINDVGVEFNAISVQIGAVDWTVGAVELKTHTCLSIGNNTWEYRSGEEGNEEIGWTTIKVIKDTDAAWLVTVEGFDKDKWSSFSTKSYKIKPLQPLVVEEDGTYELLAQSTQTDVLNGEEKTFPEKTYVAQANGPTSVGGAARFEFDLLPDGGDKLVIQIPKKEDYADPQIAREFIVAAKITSSQSIIKLALVDECDKDITYVSNGDSGKDIVAIPQNVWNTLRITEVGRGRFEVEDFGANAIKTAFAKANARIDEEISTRTEKYNSLLNIINLSVTTEKIARKQIDVELSGAISAEIETRISADEYLSGEIKDLWKNIRGGINYAGALLVDDDNWTIHDIIAAEISPQPEYLRKGFFYLIKTPDKNKHYLLDGLEVEHGDWLIISKNIELSNITSADVAIFDAQDHDGFRLSSDNSIAGNNTFTGNTTFAGELIISSGGYANFNSPVQVLAGISANTLSASVISAASEVIDKSCIKDLTVDLSRVKYSEVSSLEDLSISLQNQLTNAQLSVNGISSLLSTELSNEVRYFGTLTKGYDSTDIHDFFRANLGSGVEIRKGFVYRIKDKLEIAGFKLFKNDYIIANATKNAEDLVITDFDIIRDAQVEGETLCAYAYGISSKISDDIIPAITDLCAETIKLSLSAEELSSVISNDISNSIRDIRDTISAYDSTLSGIDRANFNDEHISSNNLILTDVLGGTTEQHVHKRYYMTFLSGTLVLKQID